ncbi:response regulator transcription factor [Flavobacterium silvaticum]|uniref:Response regulator transcription factor n=1 Tax=Flavobacterium silvaticum TaxID=1852020 RepID=A0A972FL96_9FLAO|nr:response regulator transcription factor [Flavobacterium silvaticum]NMH27310.1 response regulator transcription factor [Flavobacterium silvaticum]
MHSKIKIYLADDHQLLLDGLVAVLGNSPEFEIVGTAMNGEDLIQKATASNADILVMDINMPVRDGIEVLKEFAALPQPFRIIVLSSYDEIKLIREVMKLGASSYLTKQCAGENIIEAVEAVQRGEEYFCKTVREKIFNSFAGNNPKINSSGPNYNLPLTEREIEILKLLSLEYSGKQISEFLFISFHTVESHRKNLLKKINVKSTVGLVKYAIKHQLINP